MADTGGIDDDGSFYAVGAVIHKRPERKEGGISLGFPIAEISEWVQDRDIVAERIAAVLNQSDDN